MCPEKVSQKTDTGSGTLKMEACTASRIGGKVTVQSGFPKEGYPKILDTKPKEAEESQKKPKTKKLSK